MVEHNFLVQTKRFCMFWIQSNSKDQNGTTVLLQPKRTSVKIGLPQIQLWKFAYIRLLNRPYENEVTSKGHN